MARLTPEQTESRRRSGQVSARRWNAKAQRASDRAAGLGVLMGGDSTCGHHWMLPQPNGPLSLGKCKKCDGAMWMVNSTEIGSWTQRNDATKMLTDDYGMSPL